MWAELGNVQRTRGKGPESQQMEAGNEHRGGAALFKGLAGSPNTLKATPQSLKLKFVSLKEKKQRKGEGREKGRRSCED